MLVYRCIQLVSFNVMIADCTNKIHNSKKPLPRNTDNIDSAQIDITLYFQYKICGYSETVYLISHQQTPYIIKISGLKFSYQK